MNNDDPNDDWPDEPVRMTKEERHEFVLKLIANEVFTTEHIPKHQIEQDLGFCFMPLMMGCFSGAPKTFIENVGVIWENMSEANPFHTRNGMPIFHSMNVMHKEDWKICAAAYQKRMHMLHDLNDM